MQRSPEGKGRRGSKIVLGGALLATLIGLVPLGPFGVAVATEEERGFVSACPFRATAQVDPIVAPGVPSAHMHEFFGTQVDANSTYESLRAGGTNCSIKEDTAGYWIPSLYTPDGAGNPVKRNPVSLAAYYIAEDPPEGEVKPFPPNMKLIAGNANAGAYEQDLSVVWFDCAAPEDQYSPRAHAPYLCSGGQFVRAHVKFPSCWDGVPPAPVGNDSIHVSYPDHGVCPNGTLTLPQLHLSMVYGITDGRNATLASGGGKDDPNSIFTLHGDFFNAWEQRLQATLVEECLAEEGPDVACGLPATSAIKTIKPNIAQVGTIVEVGGDHFTGVQAVKFNGMPTTFTVASEKMILALVPPGATTGIVSVTTDGGTGIWAVHTRGYSKEPFVVT
jgi:hypothetical protein